MDSGLREEGELERQGEEGTVQQGCVKYVWTSLPPEGVTHRVKS